MGNFKETREELKNYILARTPLIIIETSERERAERMLLSICKELTTDMYYYTETKQVIKIGSSTSNSIDVANDPLLFIADIFKKKNNVMTKPIHSNALACQLHIFIIVSIKLAIIRFFTYIIVFLL